MGEYAALLSLTSAGIALAGLLVLFHVRVKPRRRRSQVAASEPPIDTLALLGRFQTYAALFVAFGALALLLTAWVARAETLGRVGLGIAALVTAPLLVGFAHLVAHGGPGDDES